MLLGFVRAELLLGHGAEARGRHPRGGGASQGPRTVPGKRAVEREHSR
jgi:hypothetical protein